MIVMFSAHRARLPGHAVASIMRANEDTIPGSREFRLWGTMKIIGEDLFICYTTMTYDVSITLDKYPTPPAMYAQGQRFSLKIKGTPELIKLTWKIKCVKRDKK